jgi:hypothetical protein
MTVTPFGNAVELGKMLKIRSLSEIMPSEFQITSRPGQCSHARTAKKPPRPSPGRLQMFVIEARELT